MLAASAIRPGESSPSAVQPGLDLRYVRCAMSRVAAALSSLLLWTACGGGYGEGACEKDCTDAYCVDYCAALGRCFEIGEDCEDGCRQNNPDLSPFRASFLRDLAGCFEALECRDMAEPQSFEACYRQAQLDAVPSGAVGGVCVDLELRAYACERGFDPACSESLAHFSDPAVERARACTAAPCEQLFDCIPDRILNR